MVLFSGRLRTRGEERDPSSKGAQGTWGFPHTPWVIKRHLLMPVHVGLCFRPRPGSPGTGHNLIWRNQTPLPQPEPGLSHSPVLLLASPQWSVPPPKQLFFKISLAGRQPNKEPQ